MTPAIVLFDGLCNLCDGAVRFMLERDRAGRLRFASLQSDAARDALARFGRPRAATPESIVVIDGDRLYERSDAALHIATLLGPPWSFARLLGAIPASLRDAAYAAFARNRYRIFGKRDACRIPSTAERARFL